MNVRIMLMVAALALAAGCAENSRPTKQKLTMEQTPISVRRGIQWVCPDGKVKQIERQTYKDTGVVRYEVELTTVSGRNVKFKLAEDGELLLKD